MIPSSSFPIFLSKARRIGAKRKRADRKMKDRKMESSGRWAGSRKGKILEVEPM
jgi:hypothetical protein